MNSPTAQLQGGDGSLFNKTSGLVVGDVHSRGESAALFCLYAGLFTLSWHIVRPGDINITLSDSFFLIVIIYLLFRGKLNSRPFGPLTSLWFLGIMCLIGGLFIGSIFNGSAVRWISVSGQYLFALLAVPMMLASFRQFVLDRCLTAFVLGVCLAQASAIAASYLFTYDQIAEWMGYTFVSGAGRIGALSGNANTNGAMTVFGLVAVFYLIRRQVMHPVLAIPCFAILAAGLIMSGSFTAFALGCLAVPAALLLLWPTRTLVFGIPIVITLISLVVSGVPLPEAFGERVAPALLSGDISMAGTFQDRMAILSEAWSLASDTLLIGYGADGYREVSIYQSPVHMLPLLILTEGGLLGFAGFLFLVSGLVAMAVTILRSNRLDAALAIGLLIAFVGFTLAAAHMYARMWTLPLLLAIIHAYAARFELYPASGGRVPAQTRHGAHSVA